MTNTPISTFRSLLADNRLSLVLEELQGQLADTDYRGAVLSLAARHKALQRDLIAGVITQQESRLEESRLVQNSLLLLDQIEKGEPYTDPTGTDEKPPSIIKNTVGGDINNSGGSIHIGDQQK